MIQIKQEVDFSKFTEETLSEYSFLESQHPNFDLTLLEHGTVKSWEVWYEGEIVLMLGVVQQSLIGELPELWVLSHKKLKKCPVVIKAMKRAFPQVTKKFKRLRIRVEHEYPMGQRFAEFFGFSKVGLDATFINYELRTI